jgi:hypothetical protein
MFMAVSVSLSAQNKNDLKKMVGNWNYTMENPMGGDTLEGTCTIAENKGEYKATFTVMGNEMTTSAFQLNNGKYHAKISTPEFEMGVAVQLKSNDVLVYEMSFEGMDSPFPAVEMKRVKK